MNKELPIIFNTEMVKAILEGRKVCTRRPLKKQPTDHHWNIFDSYKLKRNLLECQNGLFCCFRHTAEVKGQHLMDEDIDVKSPYKVNDILYVRETWSEYSYSGLPLGYIAYKADCPMEYPNGDDEVIQILENAFKWKPSIHMPREAARLFLKITNVRVERIQDIENPHDEVLKEGWPFEGFGKSNPFAEFGKLWDSIYKNWDFNPWVWVFDFEVVKK